MRADFSPLMICRKETIFFLFGVTMLVSIRVLHPPRLRCDEISRLIHCPLNNIIFDMHRIQHYVQSQSRWVQSMYGLQHLLCRTRVALLHHTFKLATQCPSIRGSFMLVQSTVCLIVCNRKNKTIFALVVYEHECHEPLQQKYGDLHQARRDRAHTCGKKKI